MNKKNIVIILFVVLLFFCLVVLSQLARNNSEISSKKESYINNFSGCGRISLESFPSRNTDEKEDIEEYVLDSMKELDLSVEDARKKVYECRNYIEENGNEQERKEYTEWILDFLDSIEK